MENEIGNFGTTNVPPGLERVVDIAAGRDRSLALTGDGRIIAWGGFFPAATNVPISRVGFATISAGRLESAAVASNRHGIATSMAMNASIRRLRIEVEPAVSDGHLVLKFPGRAGIRYQIETSTDFIRWDTLESVVGQGGTETVRILTRNDARGFYRVREE